VENARPANRGASVPREGKSAGSRMRADTASARPPLMGGACSEDGIGAPLAAAALNGPNPAVALNGSHPVVALTGSHPIGCETAARASPDTAVAEDLTGATWRQWLACGSPREVLARIVHEDPLGVREQVAHALRNGAWLIDADRVLLRTFALVSRHALRYRGRPEVDVWIRALADEAITAILREDNEVERRGLLQKGVVQKGTAPPARGAGAIAQPELVREQGGAFAALARPLGLEPRAMGRACLAFNRLPLPERRAFHALVIAGRTLDEIASESGESATDIARRARRALDAVLAGAAVGSAAPTAADHPRNAAKADERSAETSAERGPEVHP
jgi:hypothetical protein